MNVKDTIKNNFSRYAGCYDAYCGVQDQVGANLLSSLNGEKFEKILDIGCGTGNYTRLLRDKFPTAMIKAMDISDRMIEISQRKLKGSGIKFITADAETMPPAEIFGLITSNACFQWFGNLERAIEKYSGLLDNNGTFLFSIFGPSTFCELAKSLSLLYKEDIQTTSGTFINNNRLPLILEKNFDTFSVNEQFVKKTYGSLLELLDTIKYTGTRGFGLNGKSFNKSKIIELEKIYRAQFGDIKATYQVFYCQAKRDG
ncbi:MAG: methyltransferase domain-containing protein [Phycisphaerae bacterium]|nr:methyltransferase domain-containing protein [Phycisphaerae bacterium]